MAATTKRYAEYAARTKCPVAHAVARSLQPDYSEDAVFEWDFVSPDGLSMRDAWAMATQWNSRLQGHVSVSVDDQHAMFSVRPSYEWIDVWLGCGSSGEAEDLAHAARNAMLMWHTLDKCRGFSVSENAVFWKLLFSELQKPVAGSESKCHHVDATEYVTDTVAMFKDIPFPRVRLRLPIDSKVEDIETLIKAFATGNGFATEAPQLKTRNVIRGTDTTIEVALRLPLRRTLDQIKTLVNMVNCQHDKDDLSTSNRELKAPKFMMTALDPVDVASIAECDELGPVMDLPIVVHKDCLGCEHDPNKLHQHTKWALRLDTSCGGVRGLEVAVENFRRSPIAAICSALPHTQSLETLGINGIGGALYELTALDAAWIGYALFHPDTAMSTWRKLHLNAVLCSDGNKLNKMLSVMAHGNNLHAALLDSSQRHFETDEIVIEGYFSARIRTGAVVRDQEHEDAHVLDTLKASQWMDVCVTSADVASLDEWVAVIVPGYGLAWVRSTDVEEVMSRPPGEPSLTALTFSTCNITGTQVTDFIQLAGSQLEFVDLTGLSQSVITRHALPMMHTCCPLLRSLRVALYSDEELNLYPLPPQLRHLKLSFRTDGETLYYEESTLEPLCELESLVLETNESPWEEIVSNFVNPLLYSSPRLQYFGWTSGLVNANLRRNLSYLQRRFVSHETFELVDREQVGVAIIGEKAPQPTVLGLLSVIERNRVTGDSVAGTLDPIVVEQVLRFVGTTARRELVVDGEWFMIHDARTE